MGSLQAMFESRFEDVLGAAQEGAEWAWRELVQALAGPLLGYIRSQGSREPEDVLSEVLLQVARNLESFRGTETTLRSWVFTVAHSRIVDERRRRTRHPVDPAETIDEEVPPEDDVTSRMAIDAVATQSVEEMLAALPAAQRDVLLLRIVAGMSLSETAEVLDKRVGAVKALQRRGLIQLRRQFGRQEIHGKGISR
jgi:RNA polymerase sigma-70 factor (ECF subfamily)